MNNQQINLIKEYFRRGYSYDIILLFLKKYHSLNISKSTLKRTLKYLGLRRRGLCLSHHMLYQVYQCLKVYF